MQKLCYKALIASIGMLCVLDKIIQFIISHQGPVPDSKVYGANMEPPWGRQDPGWPHVGPMSFAIWGDIIHP